MGAPLSLDAPGGRVLLVDDEVAVGRTLGMLLTKHGFTTEVHVRAKEALRRVAEGDFDVVVTDIAMPEMDGIQFLRRIREHDRDVPVILITGSPSIESAREAVNYGALQYLLKPIATPEFLRALRRAVQLHRLAEAKRAALQELGTQAGEGARAALEASFERALEGLWVAFQPIVSAETKQLYGYEALVRSTEPSLPRPEALLDAAERMDRLPDLGRRIRQCALGAVPEDQSWSLFLNLHPRDLADDTLLDDVLRHSAMIPRLVLEVTERASLDSIPEAQSRIAMLRAIGCRIAIDDLGAGYAGLSSFVQLEPDVVKLDMSLVRDADKSSVKQRLIRSLTDVCQDLGYAVVGEGVETLEERDLLLDVGCDLLQGFRFGHPEPPFVESVW